MSDGDREQQTEAPTQRRIQKALEKGQVGVSGDLTSGLVFIAGLLYFWFAGAWFFQILTDVIRNHATYLSLVSWDVGYLTATARNDITQVGFALVMLLGPLFLIAVLAGGIQTQFNISLSPLELKWDKLSVMKGLRKIFSTSSLMRTGQAIAKASAVLVVTWIVARSRYEDILLSGMFSMTHFLWVAGELLLHICLAVGGMMTLLAIVDLGFQKWKHYQDLKMSVKELKDEHKETEGDPLIRARLKKLQAEASKKRMLQNVPEATVVVTNPTHFAVALQYDRSKMIAPQLTAKGADHLAKRIIEVAKKHGVPVVERKPVARFLYFNVDVGRAIPVELYQAVAEVLNFVNRLKRGA